MGDSSPEVSDTSFPSLSFFFSIVRVYACVLYVFSDVKNRSLCLSVCLSAWLAVSLSPFFVAIPARKMPYRRRHKRYKFVPLEHPNLESFLAERRVTRVKVADDKDRKESEKRRSHSSKNRRRSSRGSKRASSRGGSRSTRARSHSTRQSTRSGRSICGSGQPAECCGRCNSSSSKSAVAEAESQKCARPRRVAFGGGESQISGSSERDRDARHGLGIGGSRDRRAPSRSTGQEVRPVGLPNDADGSRGSSTECLSRSQIRASCDAHPQQRPDKSVLRFHARANTTTENITGDSTALGSRARSSRPTSPLSSNHSHAAISTIMEGRGRPDGAASYIEVSRGTSRKYWTVAGDGYAPSGSTATGCRQRAAGRGVGVSMGAAGHRNTRDKKGSHGGDSVGVREAPPGAARPAGRNFEDDDDSSGGGFAKPEERQSACPSARALDSAGSVSDVEDQTSVPCSGCSACGIKALDFLRGGGSEWSGSEGYEDFEHFSDVSSSESSSSSFLSTNSWLLSPVQEPNSRSGRRRTRRRRRRRRRT